MKAPLQNTMIDHSIFRAYDIRGIVDKNFSEDVVYQIARAIGTEALLKNIDTIVIGRDGRLSGPQLILTLQQGLLSTGINVIDIGIVPTPILYYATKILTTNSGVMLTASHNPRDYNGIKVMIDAKTLAESEIEKLYQRILINDFINGLGKLTFENVTQKYIEEICATIKLKKKLKIVIDCGNGVTGIVAPTLFRNLGCDVIELFCEVDGNFPNHHPDPSDPKNLAILIQTVQQEGADIGLAFDGDGDRLGVVTNAGEVIWADRQMMLFSKAVLAQHPGGQIIFDVKCSRHLPEVIKHYGGVPTMWKTGHSLVKAKLAETNALLAGEMSGHIFFNDHWYGFDDGLYSAARLLEILAQETLSVSELFATLPNSINTPELKLQLAEERKAQFMQDFINRQHFPEGNISTIDGLRVDFANGWGLIRSSNTTPCLILRFEANSREELLRIQQMFREQLLAIDSQLILPF